MGWEQVKINKCDGGCGWSRAIIDGEKLLDDPEYEYAWAWLESMIEWVKEHKHITQKQKDAMNNIVSNPRSREKFFKIWNGD